MKKVHAEIEYQKPDGTWVHSDICPPNCSSENLEHTYKRDSGDFTYRKYLHDCLDEWLDNSNGSGCFYIKDENFRVGEDDVAALMEAGWCIYINPAMKRMDANDGRGRDWHIRFMWGANKENGERYACDWEGFATAEECIADLVNTMREVTQ